VVLPRTGSVYGIGTYMNSATNITITNSTLDGDDTVYMEHTSRANMTNVDISAHSIGVYTSNPTALWLNNSTINATHYAYEVIGVSELYLCGVDFTNAANETVVEGTLLICGAGGAVTPTASFTGTPLTGTAPLSVQFTDSSTNTPTAWAWYWWSNESVSNITQNPKTESLAIGTYHVRLYVSNAAGGDWENKTNYITVTNATVPGTGSVAGSCTSPIVAALNTIGIMLTVVGLA